MWELSPLGEAKMTTALYRTEPGRYGVNDKCRGSGVVARNGTPINFKGVDVSRRGFGCIVTGDVNTGDTVVFSIKERTVAFHVMWCESHLGIDKMHRVGLTPVD